MSEFPQKEFYKLNEVCQYTDTQPYVLRFWESEFPQLKPEKSRSGQLIYTREDIDLVRRIKQLLHEQECTLESAREELNGAAKPKKATSAKAREPKREPEAKPSAESGSSAVAALRRKAKAAEPEEELPAALPFKAPEGESVSRRRYDDAVEEIDHLRLQLREAEKHRRKAEAAAKDADERGERYRRRAARAGERIEQLLDSLS